MANTSNYKSINQIIGIFRDLSGWHKQINDFGYGPEYQIGRRRGMKYPFLWVSLDNPTDLPRGANGYSTIDYNITIHVYDKLNNELKEDDKLGEQSNNAIEVSSDTSQIVMDLVQLLYRHPLYKNMNLSLEGDISLNYEYDVLDDGDNGTVTDLTIRSLYDGGWCSAPIDIPGYETSGMLLPDYTSIESTICGILSNCTSFTDLESDVVSNTNDITTLTGIVDNLDYLPLSGGTLTGPVILSESIISATTSATTVDTSLSSNYEITLESSTDITFNNFTSGLQVSISVIQDSTGGWTITWPTGIKWKNGGIPTQTADANSTDVYTFIKINDIIYASVIQNFLL